MLSNSEKTLSCGKCVLINKYKQEHFENAEPIILKGCNIETTAQVHHKKY